ncbi:MAG: L-threonylcarbamoyladenylate synthase [Bacteroidota bacterium]
MAEIGSDISKAKTILQNGGLVAIPTETVYGLAGNALDLDAVASIFSAKNRPSFDPLIVHVGSINEAKKYTLKWTEKAHTLAREFWPGPLTLLLEKRDSISDLVTSGMQKVAIRVPSQKLTLDLLHVLDFPLVAPSANPFGYVSPTSPTHVNDQLGIKIPYILNGGDCEIGLESTIVGFDTNDEPTIYRLGGLSVEQIESVIGKTHLTPHSSSNPQAPGMLKSHYAPSVSIRLGNIEMNLKKFVSKDDVGIISFNTQFENVPEKNQLKLAPDKVLNTAAKNLFSALRYMDTLKISTLLIEEVPDYGLGKAINDRLRRAAAK